MSNEKGKVYLVGAGPGDPGLITKKGYDTLRKVDVVCYDALVDPTIVATIPDSIEKLYVGKRAGRHSKPQDEIETLLVELAFSGKNVARLKGGDPFIFGRGGEEAIALKKAGISFEVIPGVTAATAATAYAGIPATHRGLATWTLLFTAHEADGKNQEALLHYDKLASLGDGTLIGYMGIRQLPNLVNQLVEGGLDPQTPAAIIERGSTPAQRVVRDKLEKLPESVKNAGVKPPGLIVIGKTTDLSGKLDWYNKGVLAGKRILVTRPSSQADPMYERLGQLGASVIPAPSIKINESFDQDGWDHFRKQNNEGGWIVFTSENGVNYFVKQLFDEGMDWRALGTLKIAVIGAGTERAMFEVGLKADFKPSVFTVKQLAAELTPKLEAGEIVFRIRGNLADNTLEDAATDDGAKVYPIEVYNTVTADLDDGVRTWVEEAPVDVITFTSGSTVTSFVEQWGKDKSLEIAENAAVVSIGPSTSRLAESEGFKVSIEAKPHSVEGIIDAILKWSESR